MPELREIFERAVADPPPEPHTPADVLRAAHGADRRRRTWVVVGATAASVALVALVAVATLLAGQEAPAPAPAPTRSVVEQVPVTPGALAALVVDHLEAAPSEVAKNESPSFPSGAVATEVRLPAQGGGEGGSVVAVAAPTSLDDAFPCAVMTECVDLDTDAGPVRLAWLVERPEQDPGYVVVIAGRHGEGRAVGWGGDRITGDPRELDLAVSVDDLVAIVTDPRLGMTTTPELVAAGAEYFPGEASSSAPATGLEPMTSGALVALAREYVAEEPGRVVDYSDRLDHAGPAAYLRFGPRRLLVLGVVPGRLPIDECRKADECVEVGEGLRLGWEVALGRGEPGYLVLEWERSDETRLVMWQQRGVTGDPREGPLKARVNQLTALIQDPRFALLTDPALVAAAPELPPTDDTSGG